MNNDQFRRLLSSEAKQRNASSATPGGSNSSTSSLGTKRTSMVPMTPRTVTGGAGVDFARQVRERNAALQPTKKFKSAAPKGSKFAAGYTDRARARMEAEDEESAGDKAKRIQALEEQMKLGQISVEMFEALRDQITGGDVGSTHLVKGLDRRLLERVRRGEDVMGTSGEGSATQQEEEPAVDIDDELDKLEEKQVEVVQKEKTEKKGSMAPPSLAGRKRTRDEIMAELKAQRKAAAEARAAAEPKLDGRWKKLGEKGKSRIEIDHKGREVLITVDEDGVVKKKVRKVQAEPDDVVMAMPDTEREVLGADAVVPISQPVPSTCEALPDEDEDIFEGVGTDYDPLGTAGDEDDTDDDDLEEEDNNSNDRKIPAGNDAVNDTAPPTEPPTAQSNDDEPAPRARRNYFNDRNESLEAAEKDRMAGVQDFLKKAAKLDSLGLGEEHEEGDEGRAAKEARLKKRAQMLANQDRDLEDMDLGFGGSRMDDAEDGEGEKKMKLSEWKGGDDKDGWEEDDGKGGGKTKKQRRPKKRQGDVNNMSDIMRVIEGRKGGGSGK